MGAPPTPSARTLLVLGRVSNLPTVASNCLAGWLLGGAGSWDRLGWMCLGGSMLYIGGMYLNDAFDADFDRLKRRSRPIPAGLISEELVWQIGGGLTAAGFAVIALLGRGPALWGALTVAAVVLYDAAHKAVTFSPVLMAACRFFLFLAAAASGRNGLTGLAVWAAAALAGWIVGLSYVARREATPSAFSKWPLLSLSTPLALAMLADNGAWRGRAIVAALALVGWTGWCLRHVFVANPGNPGLTVSGLLAGICLVDWLAALPGPQVGAIFLLLFGLALLAQRRILAT